MHIAPAERDPEAVLRQVWGFPSFRGQQDPAIRHITAGGDALVLMPTGGGKSLCYQVPALCRPGLGLVVSPLIALMDDQVAALGQLGVAAGALHSDLELDASVRTRRAIEDGTLALLYCSPERLLTGGTIELLRGRKLALIAIDEAHCVSAWGHEFRPEYRALSRLAATFPGVPRVALTATADARTRDDILSVLDMRDATVFASSFHRPNLRIAAKPRGSETAELARFLRGRDAQCGILYCGSRAKTERVAGSLSRAGRPALAFHAGLSAIEKRAALTRFRGGEPLVVAATIAFGMGMDRPDVRFVLHLDMPDSPESFYQQIGRAGRDGERADTLLLYGPEDFCRARYFQAQSSAPDAQKAVMRARLEAMIAVAECAGCRTAALLACFGETLAAPCGHCDGCVSPGRTFDGMEVAQKALSAVYRTGQVFGARHLVSVLRGEKTDAVEKHRHDKLGLFGIGRDRSTDFWRGVLRQLVAHGALRIRPDTFGSLELVPEAARPLLRGESGIVLREDDPPPPRVRKPSLAPGAAGVADDTFERLRVWRSAEAKRQGLPPYVIFHDSVLRDIATTRPATKAELAEIKGVGASKLERYGEAILAAMRG